MKSDKTFLKNLLVSFIVILSSYTLRAQIEVVQCYTSTGSPVVAGDKWYETYNGVEYECICDKSIGADCVPISSSSSSSNYTSSTNDLNGQIMKSIVEPLFQNLLDWIFSPSTPTNTTNSSEYDSSQWEAQNEEYNRLHAEYQKKVLEQVTKANTEYTNYNKEKFENQKQSTVNEFKNRIAKSESVKNIKLLNCAASRSLEISHLVIDGELDFRDLTGPAEDLSVLSDFENIKLSDCPEIEVKVPEVTTVNRVAFQEVFFQTIKMKSDSIGVKVGLIKEKEKKIKEVIIEKEKVIEQLKTKEPVINETIQDKSKEEEDKLLQDALDALNEAIEEEKKVTEELQTSEKDIEQLEKIRSVYDIKEKK